MSVTMCVYCDTSVDTDYHEYCPVCERCPFGENTICLHCEDYEDGKCLNLLSGRSFVNDTDDSCDVFEDCEYSFPRSN